MTHFDTLQLLILAQTDEIKLNGNKRYCSFFILWKPLHRFYWNILNFIQNYFFYKTKKISNYLHWLPCNFDSKILLKINKWRYSIFYFPHNKDFYIIYSSIMTILVFTILTYRYCLLIPSFFRRKRTSWNLVIISPYSLLKYMYHISFRN